MIQSKLGISGSSTPSHDQEHLSPYLREDLNDAVNVPLEQWTEAVFNLPEGGLDIWARKIASCGWFDDEVIGSSLIAYCAAEKEVKRYKPFAQLANRIVELARGTLTGVGETYPVDDFCFVEYNRQVDTIEDHEGLGAVRKPDVLGVRKHVVRKLFTKDSENTQATVPWTDILLVLELKFRHKDLHETLDEVKALRKEKRILVEDSSGGLDLAEEPHRKGDLLDPLHEGNVYISKPEAENSETAPINAAVQTASYALEVLSCTYGTRQFCLSVILKDEAISLWYYDASGIVYTADYISIIENFEIFAAIIVGFACCTPEQFGVFPTSVLQPHIPYAQQFPLQSLKEGTIVIPDPLTKERINVTMDQCLFAQHILIGRRTFLYTVDTDPVISKDKLIMKVSYQVTTRRKEYDLVALVKEKIVRHLPQIHLWADLWQLSDGVRDLFLQKDKQRVKYEDRVLRAIIYTRYSQIRPLFSENIQLIPVMVDQMIDCLSDLWYKANILHRDVSVNNIMYEKRGDYYHFVLIDFDMAIELPDGDLSDYSPSSKHRTGTLPFMAYELIEDAFEATRVKFRRWRPMPHVLYHDMQSLFWVAVWCGLVLFRHTLHDDERKALLEFVAFWEDTNMNFLAAYKANLARKKVSKWPVPHPVPFDSLAGWFDAWSDVLRSVAHAQEDREAEVEKAVAQGRDPAPFDEHTVGGTITPQVLKNALSPFMPLRQKAPTIAEKMDREGTDDAAQALGAPSAKPELSIEEKDEHHMHDVERHELGPSDIPRSSVGKSLHGGDDVEEAFEVPAPGRKTRAIAKKAVDEATRQALEAPAAKRQTRAARKKQAGEGVKEQTNPAREVPVAKCKTRATAKRKAEDGEEHTAHPVSEVTVPVPKRQARATARRQAGGGADMSSDQEPRPRAAKYKTRATTKKAREEAMETSHPVPEAPAPRPPPQRQARKRARPQEQEVAAENDIRARLRPRRRLA
ncbi:hypothetical protein NM688_g3990 [Phlebia brevispora]|uniref:Uncharacterized protein n=1 Tax=Phlebia brevispora TaxID=194682 RepID=A0ACC1T458_9APHY|nr:hypothetical protein NM688_g3990 [Phlebia brevispora]